jgi:hypothetical protein
MALHNSKGIIAEYKPRFFLAQKSFEAQLIPSKTLTSESFQPSLNICVCNELFSTLSADFHRNGDIVCQWRSEGSDEARDELLGPTLALEDHVRLVSKYYRILFAHHFSSAVEQ